MHIILYVPTGRAFFCRRFLSILFCTVQPEAYFFLSRLLAVSVHFISKVRTGSAFYLSCLWHHLLSLSSDAASRSPRAEGSGNAAGQLTDRNRGWRRSVWGSISAASGERAGARRWRGGTCWRCPGGKTLTVMDETASATDAMTAASDTLEVSFRWRTVTYFNPIISPI